MMAWCALQPDDQGQHRRHRAKRRGALDSTFETKISHISADKMDEIKAI